MKNNIDISELFTNLDIFQTMYMNINETTSGSTLTYMAWSLYIFTNRCFRPGSETQQLMLCVQAVVQKLTDILR